MLPLTDTAWASSGQLESDSPRPCPCCASERLCHCGRTGSKRVVHSSTGRRPPPGCPSRTLLPSAASGSRRSFSQFSLPCAFSSFPTCTWIVSSSFFPFTTFQLPLARSSLASFWPATEWLKGPRRSRSEEYQCVRVVLLERSSVRVSAVASRLAFFFSYLFSKS